MNLEHLHLTVNCEIFSSLSFREEADRWWNSRCKDVFPFEYLKQLISQGRRPAMKRHRDVFC